MTAEVRRLGRTRRNNWLGAAVYYRFMASNNAVQQR